jgi:hypothetical protein
MGVNIMLKYLLILVVSAFPAYAQSMLPVELQQFQDISESIPLDDDPSIKKQVIVHQQEIIPLIKKNLAETTILTLTKAEQIFCYHVTKRPKGFNGYTINGMAITGYCGELDAPQAATAYEALFTHNQNILTTVSDCHIEPRIMLRFARGVDYADVLLSSPCPSFTIFSNGRFKSFNIKQGVIDDIIQQLEKEKQPFYSPTLLKQTAANGKISSIEEETIVAKKKKELEPVLSWKEQQAEAAKKAEQEKPQGGWIKKGLNLRKQ